MKSRLMQIAVVLGLMAARSRLKLASCRSS